MASKPVYTLTKSFGRFSAGTKFNILEIIEDNSRNSEDIAVVETHYPIGPTRLTERIPLDYLTAVRNRSK